MLKKDKSVEMSAPPVRTLYGVEIKKLPIGRYIKLLQQAESFLPDILSAIFPANEDGRIVFSFSNLTADDLRGFLGRAMAVIPEKICQIAEELLDIPADRLLDPNTGLTPNEFVEILIALWEVNDLSDFFPNARKLGGLIGLSVRNTGSSAGLE